MDLKQEADVKQSNEVRPNGVRQNIALRAPSSRLKEFYKKTRGERIDMLRAFANLPVDQTLALGQDGALDFDLSNLFIENAIGNYPLPLGLVTNIKINQRDWVAPFAVEESSVVAATSNAARMVYMSGGFKCKVLSSQMIGQIQLLDLPTEQFETNKALILQNKELLLKVANEFHPRLVMRGGGVQDIEVNCFSDAQIPFMTVHILIDCRDAMGANLVNTVCEGLAPKIAELTGARIGLRILSNYADRRVYRTECHVPAECLAINTPELSMSGKDVAKRIVEAFCFADNDPYRAATHNKGIMNGVDPLVIATGNDWRAIEAGAHAFASRTGRYRSLSQWSVDSQGSLHGSMDIPLQLGTVGGITRLHPLARLSMQILGNPSSDDLSMLAASTGLAANLAALKALVTTGIQKGHMKLHAKNLALAAGAQAKEVELIAAHMVQLNKISASTAEELLERQRLFNSTQNNKEF